MLSSLRRRPLLLALIGLVLLLAAVFVIIADSGPDKDKDKAPATTAIPLKLPGPDVKVEVDKNQSLDAGEQQEAKDAGIDLHEDAKDETPPGVPAAVLARGEKATQALSTKELVTPEKPGGAQNYRCTNRPVRNQSGLTSRRVGTALHFTVSGPGSGPAIIRLFDTSSFGASSNRLIELKGTCWTLVSNGRKAWAQLAANSAYISIEIVTKDLSRAQWLAAPILKRGILAALVRDLQRSVGSPLRHVNPVGCAFTPGITDHNDLECGNTHWDVGTHFPWDVFMRQVRSGSSAAPLTKRQRKACDLLNFHRGKAHAAGGYTPVRLARAKALKKQIPTGRCLPKRRR